MEEWIWYDVVDSCRIDQYFNDWDFRSHVWSQDKYFSGHITYYYNESDLPIELKINLSNRECKKQWEYNEYGQIVKSVAHVRYDGTKEWIGVRSMQWGPLGHGGFHGGNYEDGGKHEYYYDDNGVLVEHISHKWDKDHSQWIGEYKDDYSYDESGNLTMHTKYSQRDSEWVGRSKIETSYDLDGHITLVVEYSGTSSYNDWELRTKNYYYYSSRATSRDDKLLDRISFFLTPPQTSSNITGLSRPAEIKLYSIQGQLVKSILQVESIIDISDLATGVYILNVTSEEQVLRERIVKR